MTRLADILVYLDDVQFTRRDWRNRNLISDGNRPEWLTVPLMNSGNYFSKICEMRCSEPGWWRSHLSSLDRSYNNQMAYQTIRRELSETLQSADGVASLSEINGLMNKWVFSFLGISTATLDSRSFPSSLRKTERLVDICKAVGATEYISGPAARNYLDENLFIKNSITVRWVDYSCLPPLPDDGAPKPEFSILHHLATVEQHEAIRLSTFVPIPPRT